MKDWTKGPCTFPNGANTGEARSGWWPVVGGRTLVDDVDDDVTA